MLKLYKFIIAFLCFYCTIISAQALAVDYDKEYQNSAAALDIINAKVAYSQNITGAGVSVGVFDQATRADHPEFNDGITVMPAYLIDGTLYTPPWTDENMHGTHVSGIIAANRDGVGMHGVAYGADLFTMSVLPAEDDNVELAVDFKEFFRLYPQVRIVNNSWGSPFFPYMPYTATAADNFDILKQHEVFNNVQAFIDDMLQTGVPPLPYQMAIYALENPDKVFVWAGGNDGFPVGSYESFMPRYVGSALSNWLNVGSVNSFGITKNSAGGLDLSSGGISDFSDLAAGLERWTVFAPGSMILSADAANLDYVNKSGTSMASPVVSGVLALVQQKYPWMTGKQLVDTVLSTANNNITFSDGYIVQWATQSNTSLKRYDLIFTYIGQAAPVKSKDEIIQMVTEYYNDNRAVLDSDGISLSSLLNLIDSDHYALVGNVDAEAIIGQGIVDAGKAVGGIAELDANRMTEKNVINIPELNGRSDAVEVFNTMGYSGEFSNDISQFKWNDKYHFIDYKTTANGGDTMYNAAAEALSGKDIGIMKTGVGHLILSGDNSYAGATIVDGGTLSIATRMDGSGGNLQNSDVIVRSDGTLSGNGTIATQVINNGIVAPGMFGLTDVSVYANTTLNINDYVQGASGTLQINFDNDGNHGKLNATNYTTNGGKLIFNPVVEFYDGNTYNFAIFEGASPTAAFSSTEVADISPTLDFTFSANNLNSYTLNIQRAPNAYSQYADDTTSRELGDALVRIARNATGDMQNLLTALDFSSSNGHDVKKALKTLGPETYDNLSQISLRQQNSFNSFVMQRILAQNKTNFPDQNSNGLAAGDIPSRTHYQVWGQVFGTLAHQGEYEGVEGYTGSGIGLITGLDYTWDSGFTAGLHVGLVRRNTDALGEHDAYTETESFSLGLQASFAPEQWGGFYAMAQGRLGFEQNDMHRTINIGSYERTNDSKWIDFVGSMLVGGGKDWTANNFNFGPLVWLEYSFVQRPEISESNGMATRLEMDATHYNSIRSALGFHVGYVDDISETLSLEFDVLAAWQHELLYGNVSTTTSFADYGDMKFNSETPLLGRNTYSLNVSLRLNHVDNFFAQFDVGGEITDANGQALNFGLKFGYNF